MPALPVYNDLARVERQWCYRTECLVPAVFTFILIPMVATILGGIVATVRAPGPTLRSAIQHFAAGVVFAAVAGELLPDVLHERAPLAAVVGFSLGIALMLGVKALSKRLQPAGGAGRTLSTGLIVTLGIDIFVDGLLIGIGFAAGARQGLLLTVALTVELLFLGLAAAVAFLRSGVSRAKTVAGVTGLAVLAGAGAVGGTVLLGGLAGPALEVVLAFGLAALLYLVTEELLVEAHEVPETPLTTAIFFIGFLFLVLLEMAAQPPLG